MAEIECVARKWGNSLGFIVPREIVEREGIAENAKVLIEIKRQHYAKELFGLLSDWKRPTEDIKKEMKKGW